MAVYQAPGVHIRIRRTSLRGHGMDLQPCIQGLGFCPIQRLQAIPGGGLVRSLDMPVSKVQGNGLVGIDMLPRQR